jgi:hypothetical protein
MALRRDAENVPENVHDSVGAFFEALVAEGLTGFQCTEPEPCAGARERRWLENCSAPVSEQSEAKPFTYEPPKLVDFTGGRAARGDCTDHGSQGGAMCVPGAGASSSCYTGACWCTKGEALGNDACCDGSGGAIGANFCWNGGSVAGDCIGGGNPYCGHCGTGCNQ